MYELVSANPHDTFEHAGPWRGELGAWQCELRDGRLEATSGHSFESDSAARESLEAELRAWEAVAYLRDQYEIRFVSTTGTLAEPEPGREQIYRRANATYPEPDPAFRRTPLVDELIETNRAFAERRMDLPTAVRELLAAVTGSVGGSDGRSVEEAYNIDHDVVAKLTELARRTNPTAHERPFYRGPEWQWMQEALRLITIQVGSGTDTAPSTPLTAEAFRSRL